MTKYLFLIFTLISCMESEIEVSMNKASQKVSELSYNLETSQNFLYEIKCSDPKISKEADLGNISITSNQLIYSSSNSGEDFFSLSCDDEIIHFNITIENNNPPSLTLNDLTTDEDSSLNFELTFDSQSEVSFTLLNDVSNGSLSGTFPNFTYTPNPNFNGSDSFRFSLNNGKEAEFNLNITVNPVNDLPTSSNSSVTVAEDNTVLFSLVASDIDSALTYSINSNVSNGILNCINEICTYSPNLNFNGSDSFIFEVSDGEYTSSSTVDITISSVNDIPIVNPLSFSTNEDTTLNFNLSATDDSSLTFTTTTPSSGFLNCLNDICMFSPDLNFTGTVTFNYIASDGTYSPSSTVQIDVNPVNDLPQGANNSYSLDMNTNVNIALTGSDVEGDSLTYITTNPSNGVLSCTSNNCTYTPTTDFSGADSFDYYISDGTGNSSTYTINLTVNFVNTPPVAASESLSTDENVNLNLTLQGSDVDSDPLTYIIETNPSNGSLSCSNENCTYTPNTDYYGSDSFTYKVNDGTDDSSTETISITVNLINSAPIASHQAFLIDYNATVTRSFVASDPDSDPLTFEIVSPPTQGTISITGGDFEYTHNTTVLSESFTYRAFDGIVYSPVRTVNLTIKPDPNQRDNSIKIEINPNYIKTVENFPFYFNLKNLPLDFWNNVQNDGGDITVSNDAGNRVPMELIGINTTSRTGIIWFKGSSSNYFYINYNNSATSDVTLAADDSEFGRFNVWTEYVAVWHLDYNGGAVNAKAGDLVLMPEGVPSFQQSSNSILENSISFNSDDGNNDVLHTAHDNSLNLNEMTIESWVFSNNEEEDSRILQKRNGELSTDYGLFLDFGYPTFRYNDGLDFQSNNKINTNEWNYLSMTYDGSIARSYINGNLDAQLALNVSIQQSNDIFEIGGIRGRDARGFFGNIDEIRIANKAHSQDWLKINYDQLNNNDFWLINDQSTILDEKFSVANSNDLPIGWVENESISSEVFIEDNKLKINANDQSYLPLVNYDIGSFTSGIMELSFLFKGNRFGLDNNYEFYIQLIDQSASDYYNNGIASNIKWSGSSFGMTSENGFGFRSDNVTSEILDINNVEFRVRVIADLDNKKYRILTDYIDTNWIDFEDLSLTEIDSFRFYTNEVNGSQIDISLDNIRIIHY